MPKFGARTNSVAGCRRTHHQPAINFRDEPPHRLLARYVVKYDSAAPMLFSIFYFLVIWYKARVGRRGSGGGRRCWSFWPIVASPRASRHAKSGSEEEFGTRQLTREPGESGDGIRTTELRTCALDATQCAGADRTRTENTGGVS